MTGVYDSYARGKVEKSLATRGLDIRSFTGGEDEICQPSYPSRDVALGGIHAFTFSECCSGGSAVIIIRGDI